MAVKIRKPVTPGQRFRTDLNLSVDKKEPEKALVSVLKGPVGRSKGKISVRHKERCARKYYRIIDFKRDKFNIPAKVYSIEYDPSHGPNAALLHYADGEKRYILCPQGLKKGSTVESGENVEIRTGNALPVKNIPLGTPIHNIELTPGRGGQLVRGAGTSALITAKEGKYVNVKLPSGEIRRILGTCLATIGTLSNADRKSISIGKAGRKRHMGVRPTVRGVAMPHKHPHGGSYKTSGVGRKTPVSPWGQPSKGYKTRKQKKQTDKFILRRRK